MLSSTISSITIFLFFFNATATTEIYSLSLHDALPIFDEINLITFRALIEKARTMMLKGNPMVVVGSLGSGVHSRSEEHTSELQSHVNLVCRLLLEKKKKMILHMHRNTIDYT